MFVESPRWTELQNVQMTSSTEHSRLFSGYSVYTPPTTFDNDVTSLEGFPQVTSSLVVPCTADSSTFPAATGGILCGIGFNNDVTHLPTMIPYTDDEDAWIAMSPASATSLPTTQHQTMMMPGNSHCVKQYPLIVSSSSAMPDSVAVNDEFMSFSYHSLTSHPTMFPPSPPDSMSSRSSSVELSVTPASGRPLPAPPSYPAQLTAARKTGPSTPATSPPPPPYPAQSRMIEPVLTPKSRRPRLTQPGCSTIRYNRRNQRPDIEQRRTHFCDFPGTRPSVVYLCTVIQYCAHRVATVSLRSQVIVQL